MERPADRRAYVVVVSVSILSLYPSFYVKTGVSIIVLFRVRNYRSDLGRVEFPRCRFLSYGISVRVSATYVVYFRVFVRSAVVDSCAGALREYNIYVNVGDLWIGLYLFKCEIVSAVVRCSLLIRVSAVCFNVVRLFSICERIRLLRDGLYPSTRGRMRVAAGRAYAVCLAVGSPFEP